MNNDDVPNYLEFCESLDLDESGYPITYYESHDAWADNYTGSIGRYFLYWRQRHPGGKYQPVYRCLRLMDELRGDGIPSGYRPATPETAIKSREAYARRRAASGKRYKARPHVWIHRESSED